MIKKYTLLGLFLSLSITIFAQGMDFMKGSGGQMPNGTIYGKLIDSATNKGVEAAMIELLQMKMDSATKKPIQVVVDAVLSNKNAQFRMENIPLMGQYTVKITSMGYKTRLIPFSFIDRNAMKQGKMDMSKLAGGLDKDLGNIKLSIDNQTLEGVVVRGTTPSVKMGIDRKIYNVENSMTSAGGTATDVLKNIPSVNVDIDGNISIRNSSPQVFVDGRPTTLTLDQIPSDQIETIEVITNPSAKYDASGGTAGILNIVLKKNRRPGYNGDVRANIDQRGKIGFGGNINAKQGKVNLFANVFYNQRKSISNGSTDRTTTFNNTTTKMLQTDQNNGGGNFMFSRLGFDYLIDNRNTLTVSGMLMGGKFKNSSNSNILIDSISSMGDRQSKILRYSDGDSKFRNLGGAIGFVHNFPTNGHQLTADLNYNKSRNENLTTVSNNNYANINGPATGTYNQQQNGKGNNERITAQIDYTNPIADNSKIETGARLNQSNVYSENILSVINPNGSVTVLPPLSSKFKYTDRVWAGYGNFASKIGENFGYQIGLRLESSEYTGNVNSSVKNSGGGGYRDTANNFSIKYPVSLFPSVFLSQKLKSDQELQLNYSRRINRPGFFQLFPFTDYSDSLNLSRGNPELKPEFVNSFEFSYSKNFNKVNNLILSVYYKNTESLITRYQAKETNAITGNPVLVNTYTNANSGFVGGFEVITKNKITDWWDLTGNLNLYTSKIYIDDPSIPTPDQLYSWFGKMNNNFLLSKRFTLQITGDYTSKTILAPGGTGIGGGGGFGGGGRGWMGGVSGNAQGYSMPNYGMDAALKYEFLKNKAASITLSVNDIFKTKSSDIYTSSTFFNQHSVRTRDQQFFRLNFSYRFGKFDASLMKRKNMKSSQEGMQSGMENMPQQ